MNLSVSEESVFLGHPSSYGNLFLTESSLNNLKVEYWKKSKSISHTLVTSIGALVLTWRKPHYIGNTDVFHEKAIYP